MNLVMLRLIVLISLAGMLSCSRSSDNSFFSGDVPVLPAAIAGDDQDALVSATVTLNGSKSFDPTGATITHLWEQTAGPAVTLSSATAASPTFTAPGAASVLAFRLTVTSSNGSDAAQTSVNVKTLVVKRPSTEPWFVGYGNSGVITPTVLGGTPPLSYEWTGVESWLTITGGTTSATLSWTTPPLTDFQNFPDRAEVAVMQRVTQGRLQLKVKVTDSLGAVDEDYVNFSAGPFADSVAHENVALGEPAFLNGGATNTSGTITSWTWTGTKPSGAAISFFRPTKAGLAAATDQRFVYFVPDQLGAYEIILTQNPGAVVKVINIIAAKYVGVGNLLGKTPDPFVGECAACHAGQLGFVADFTNPWLQTGHATMFSRLLDPADPLHAAVMAKGQWKDAFNYGSNYSIDSRTVGFSTITNGINDGWAHHAGVEGFVLKDATWEGMKRRHPVTASRSNIQCESCHGPGSEHAGDSAFIRKSFDVSNCGRCHSRKQDHWEASSHGMPPSASASGNGSCNGCHTAQGFVVEMRAQEGADPHTALYAVGNLNRPVIPQEDRRGTSCQACHDPHKRTAKLNSTGRDPQLRAYGDITLRNGTVTWGGEAAVCYACHQSRTDTTAGSGDFGVRRAPHDSTAAEMLAGANGQHFSGWTYNLSPHGIRTRFVAPGKTDARQCLSCHSDVQPAKGAVGYDTLGGHTFNMTQGTDAALYTDATHTGAATVAGTKRFVATSGSTFLKKVFTGDTLIITVGADAGTYTVSSVDSARQVTLTGGAASFTGGAVTSWTLTSVKKYNVAACTQCHTTAVDFEDAARGDYDGDGTVESVQNEIAGLEAALTAAINTKLVSLTGIAGTVLAFDKGRVKYNKGGTGTMRTFPGPGVTGSDNPDIAWASLTPAQQAEWEAAYKAAYNLAFNTSDKSQGIHNTGYAVNLLQSGYKAVTGATIGAAFIPFP